MEAGTSQPTVTNKPASGGRWTWWAWCLWLPACVGFGLLLAWAAYQVAHVFAPLAIFPLAVGFVLGASLVALMRLCRMGHRPTAWLAVGLSVAAVVLGQHYFSYRAAVAEADRASETVQRAQATFGQWVQGRLPPPPSGPLDYLRRQAVEGRPVGTVLGSYRAKGAMAWLSWAIDGLLVLVPAVVIVAFALRRPFCGQCGSWYATRRSGRLGADTVRRLAKELQLSLDDSAGGGRYRLICCDQGCAPTGFSLFCGEPQSAATPEIVWLDAQQRNRVVAILDHSRPPAGS